MLLALAFTPCSLPGRTFVFLKEWLLYHKYMGVEHFFLYDNSGGGGDVKGVPTPLFERDRKSNYGIPYDDIVALSEAEVADVLDHIQPRNPQRPCRQVAAHRRGGPSQVRTGGGPERRSQAVRADRRLDGLHGHGRVPGVGRTGPRDRSKSGSRSGYDGGMIHPREMTSRFDHLDRYVTETTLDLSQSAAGRCPSTSVSPAECGT